MKNEARVLKHIEEGDKAIDLLHKANPKYEVRFNKLCRDINKLLLDVQSDFPDAQFCMTDNGLTLMLGNPINEASRVIQPQLAALSGRGLGVQIHTSEF